jgi:hypothetical protein
MCLTPEQRERERLKKARQREGYRHRQIEVHDASAIPVLVVQGLLADKDIENDAAINEAYAAFIAKHRRGFEVNQEWKKDVAARRKSAALARRKARKQDAYWTSWRSVRLLHATGRPSLTGPRLSNRPARTSGSASPLSPCKPTRPQTSQLDNMMQAKTMG